VKHIDPDILTLYVWGELPADDQARVAEHLRACPTCRCEVEALRRARRGLQLLAEEPVEVPEMASPGASSGGRPPRWRVRVKWIWPVAAGFLLASWLLFRPGFHQVAQKQPAEPASEFAVLHAEVAGRAARVFVFTPNDSVTTIWLE